MTTTDDDFVDPFDPNFRGEVIEGVIHKLEHLDIDPVVLSLIADHYAPLPTPAVPEPPPLTRDDLNAAVAELKAVMEQKQWQPHTGSNPTAHSPSPSTTVAVDGRAFSSEPGSRLILALQKAMATRKTPSRPPKGSGPSTPAASSTNPPPRPTPGKKP
jgi:hypothetical protein